MSDTFVGVDMAKADVVVACRPDGTPALVGVAPLARDSGTLRGKRLVWGGRAPA